MIDRRIAVNYAKSQVGYHEKATNDQLEDFYANSGSNNFNKYSEDLDRVDGFYNFKGKNGWPWCDTFYDDVIKVCYGVPIALQLLCQPWGSAGAGCEYSAQYYEQAGRFFVTEPEIGDQIFFDYGSGISHTGMVVEVGPDYIKTVEGNSNDQVEENVYQKNSPYIAGYGRPDWSIGGDVEPFEPDVPESEPPETTCEVTATLPIIRYGNMSVYVTIMQALLINKGYSCGRYGADGEYGPDTKNGLYQFQQANSLTADGICNKDTWQKLFE